MRAVFDTNVVTSALVFSRRLSWLRRAWASGAVIPVVWRETAGELLRVLSYPKFRLDAMEREILLADYLPFAEIAVPPSPCQSCRRRAETVTMQFSCTSPSPAAPSCW